MSSDRSSRSALLEAIVADLEVPDSAYQRAIERHAAIGEWLDRPGSTIARYKPRLHPQGSFMLGTATKPIDPKGCYDVDQVCVLNLAAKDTHTQAHVKQLVLDELRAYAKAHNFEKPVTDGNRCATIEYADEPPLSFHLDELPCVPESAAVIAALVAAGVPERFAVTAIAITDKRHPGFSVITPGWFSSNPKGFGRYFADRMRGAAMPRLRQLVEGRMYASVDDVPEFAWKTPLQRAIQLLKRHRDIQFRQQPKRKPISIVITTVAAESYQGEADLALVLDRASRAMLRVAQSGEKVTNPVNRAEDFTDRWKLCPELRLREAFGEWAVQLRRDLDRLLQEDDAEALVRVVQGRLGATLNEDTVRHAAGLPARAQVVSRVAVAAPTVHVGGGPRPWGRPR